MTGAVDAVLAYALALTVILGYGVNLWRQGRMLTRRERLSDRPGS